MKQLLRVKYFYRSFFILSLLFLQPALAQGAASSSDNGFIKNYFYKDKDGKEVSCPEDATTEPCAGIVKFLKEKTENSENYGDSQCFDDYRFNSVEADLAPTHDHAVAGVPVEFSGTITNRNPYPVFNATVYVKIFKTGNTGEVFMSQGDDLVDQFVAVENISLAADVSRSITYTYTLPRYSGAGTYRVTTSVVLNDQFNMSGLPFLDDITGPTHSFTVDSDTAAVMWDKNAVMLNGQRHEFAKPSPVFGKDEKVTVSGVLRNASADTRTVDVKASVYKWDSLKKEYFVESAPVGSYSLSEKASETVTFEVPNVDHTVTYVVLEASDHDTKSFLDIRLARAGIEWPRINFATLTSYPFESGKEVSYMACIYNLGGGKIDDVTVEQVVTDPDTGTVLAKRAYTGPFSGVMGGIKASFTPDAAHRRVDLTTRTSYHGQVYDEATVHYDCSLLGSDACPKKGIIPSSMSSAKKVLLITGAVLFGLVGGFWFRRRFSSHALILTISLLSVFFITSPVLAGAEDKGSTETFDKIVGDGNHIWGSIFYHTWVSEKSGNTIPQGTDLLLDSNWVNGDIEWFGTGKYVGGPGSPYGTWVTNLDNLRDDQAVVVNSRGIRWDPTAPTVVGHTFPTMSAEGSGAITCTGMSCLATGTGYGKVAVHHSGGRLRIRQLYTYCDDYGNCTDTGVNYDSTMKEQVHVFDNYIVTATNEAPNAPTITGPGSFLEDSAQNFSLQATDPDSDTVRYGVDWDNNGSVDEYTPTSGYVNSGTVRTVSHSWITPGTYTFKARTEDSKGGVSTWTSKVVTVTAAPAPTVIMTGRPGNKIGYDTDSFWGRMLGMWKGIIATASASGADVNIASGQDALLTWTSMNATNCTLTVPPAVGRGVSLNGTDLPISGLTTGTHTLTMECTNGSDVALDSVDVIVAAPVQAALNVCPTSATLYEDNTSSLKAWHTDTGVTFNGCAAPNGTDRTGAASWSSSNIGVASVSGGTVTGVSAGSATIQASYAGLSDTASVSVLCSPDNSCSSQSSKDKADLVCTTDIFTIPDGCGNDIVCNGTRACDYNWKEVAP